MEDTINKAIEFFLSTNCIDSSNSKSDGGVFGFQNISDNIIRESDNPFIFYEITGYGINLLLKLFQWYKDEKYLELAKNAARSLLFAQVTKEENAGVFYDKYYPHSGKFLEVFHAYPNAVCIAALCELHLITNNENYLNSAQNCYKWLLKTIIKDENLNSLGFTEFYDKNENSDKIFPYESICIPYLLLKFKKELKILSKDEDELKQIISWGISSQTKDGFFPFYYIPRNKQFNNTAYSHFTIYPLYNLMGFPLIEIDKIYDAKGTDAFLNCAKWLVSVQAVDGGFYTYYHESDHVWHQQSPSVGQALCTFVKAFEITKEKIFFKCAEKCHSWLSKNQIKTGKFEGGYYWIYPNKKISKFQKKIMYTKERLSQKISNSQNISNVSGFLDKIPVWSVQFAIEGLYRYNKINS